MCGTIPFALGPAAGRAISLATSRCLDVCGFPAGDARIAIVEPDRRHDRFGRPVAR
jgi:hypothetical protein